MKPAIAQPTHVLDINRLAHLQPPTYIHTYICHARIPSIRRNYTLKTNKRSREARKRHASVHSRFLIRKYRTCILFVLKDNQSQDETR